MIVKYDCSYTLSIYEQGMAQAATSPKEAGDPNSHCFFSASIDQTLRLHQFSVYP